jgi:hypothetical protein
MAERQIEELIRELRTLKLRVATLEAENDYQRARRESSEHTRTLTAASNNSTHDMERVNGIGRGDRVRITNTVKKPAYWTKAWDEKKERVATVIKVTPSQIHFRTDNGVNTWRAPNNVRKIVDTDEFNR